MDNRDQLSSETPTPLPLREGDLVAYIEGIISPTLAHSITINPAALSEVAALLQTEALLSSACYRLHCPTSDDLLAYQAGLLPQPQHHAIAQHVAACIQCAHDVQELAPAAQFAPAMVPAVATPSAPAPSLREHLERAGRLIQAVLRPLPAQPAFAVRGSESRTLAYQAGDYQIILLLAPPVVAESVWQIEGQIMHQQAATSIPQGADVALLLQQNTVVRDVVDEFGYFALDNVTAGHYTMRIDLAPDSILIEGIALV